MMGVWLGQIGAVIRLEMKKTFLSKRGLWVYLLALAPVGITTIHSMVELTNLKERRTLAAARPVDAQALASVVRGTTEKELLAKAGEPHIDRQYGPRGPRQMQYTDGRDLYIFFVAIPPPSDGVAPQERKVQFIQKRTRDTVQQDTVIFASIFQFFFLRLAIFFGCVGVFTNLFRGELLDRSLHYYLLSPVRREVLVVGKYFAGLLATTVIFTVSTALQMWTLSWHFEASEQAAFLANDGWWNIASYLGVTVAACVGYGSLFLVMGLMFRNPIIPAVVVELWESINIFLPAALKKISVIYYLQSMCPIVASPNEDMNRFLKLLVTAAEPVSVPVAVIGLIVVTCMLLALAGQLARRLEINYSTD